MTRAGVARGRSQVRKSESLGTDSLIFRRSEPFEVPATAHATKNFRGAKFRFCTRCCVRADARLLNRGSVTRASHRCVARARSARIIGTSHACAILRDCLVLQRKFYRDGRDARAPRHAIPSGKAAAIHNIKRIHCYFFSAGVIGIPVHVDSRLHCTDVAIHSWLGGQQWRRSER